MSLFGMWNRYWVTVVGSFICYFKSSDANTPIFKLNMSDIVSFEVSDKDQEKAFQLMTGSSLWHHRLSSKLDRDEWLNTLKSLRLGSVNLLSTIKENQTPGSPSSLVIWLDLNDLKLGKQKILIKISGRRHMRVEIVPFLSSSLNSASVFILDAGPKIYQVRNIYFFDIFFYL